jgi:type V secretory pathway adhesin AidA
VVSQAPFSPTLTDLLSHDRAIPVLAGQSPLLHAADIAGWKADAHAGTIMQEGWSIQDGTATSTQGPTEVNGNLALTGSSTLVLKGTLHVTGTLSVGSGASIQLDPSYGNKAGVIVVDGSISTSSTLNLPGNFSGDGQPGSLVLLAGPQGATLYGSDGDTYMGGDGYVSVLGSPSGTWNIQNI